MKKFRFFILFFQLFILATFTACSSSENSSLDTLKNDLKICPKCHMEVQKSSVYSATINENGHLKYFDDIGCMILWAKENKITLKTNVNVFSSDTNKYIDATKANYKINDTTPMSYGFSGHEIANKEYINFDEVVIKMLRGEHMGNPKIRQQLQNSKGLL